MSGWLDSTRHRTRPEGLARAWGSRLSGLLDEASRLTAVEIDATLADHLPATVQRMRPQRADGLSVLQQDALRLTADDVDAPQVLVANLPYNVAVPVVLHLLQVLPSLTKGLIMVQEEVADRLAAGPGSKSPGVPSAKIAWDTDTRKVGVVSTKVFWPEPRISSGLVRFQRRTPVSSSVQREQVFTVIDAAFAQRRKTLRAALGAWPAPASRQQQPFRRPASTPERAAKHWMSPPSPASQAR